MKRGNITIGVLLALAILAMGGNVVSYLHNKNTNNPTENMMSSTEDTFGADPRILTSRQLAASPQNNYILSTDGTNNSWILNSGGGGGGGLGWATTTGNILMYNTLGSGGIVLSGNSKTSTGTSAYLNIYGGVSADFFISTSTATSSTFTNFNATNSTTTNATTTNLAASTINLFGGGQKTTANSLCIQLTGDAGLCDGNDGGGGGGSNWLFNGSRLTPSTTVGIGIFASSTIGGGTGVTGLTINGTATTTGDLIVNGATRLATSITGLLKGTSGLVSTASNGTDFTLISGTTCGGTDKVSAVSASGVVTCSSDVTGGGGAGLSTSTAIASTQIIYGTSVATVGAEAAFTYDSATNVLNVDNSITSNSTTTNATTTNLRTTQLGVGSDYLTDITGSGLSIVGGALTASGGGVSDWVKNTALNAIRPTTTVGIVVSASSSIGDGTATGGLTINGGATTTARFIQTGKYSKFGDATPLYSCENIGTSCLELWGDDNTTAGIQMGIGNRNAGTSAYNGFFFNNDLADSSITHYGFIGLNSSTYNDPSFGYANNGANLMVMQNSDGPINFINSTSTVRARFGFYTGGAALSNERFVITASGTVGVGSSSPGALFSVMNTGGGSANLFTVGSSTNGAGTTTYFSIDSLGSTTVNIIKALTRMITRITNTLALAIEGEFGIDSTANQFRYYSNGVERVLGDGNFYTSFTYATSSWTGTTTIPLAVAYVDETWNGAKCYTDAGTLSLVVSDGTNNMNVATTSTSVSSTTLNVNNTFTAGEKIQIAVGSPASSPTKVTCTFSRSLTSS